MTIEQFDSAISQIDSWCKDTALHVNTAAAMNDTLFIVNVPGDSSRRISFIKDPTADDFVYVEYTDGEKFDDMCLVGTPYMAMTSVEFQADLIKNWKTIKSDIEREIDFLNKKSAEMDRREHAAAVARDRIEREIISSIPEGFEL